jgi:hypothetical protein
VVEIAKGEDHLGAWMKDIALLNMDLGDCELDSAVTGEGSITCSCDYSRENFIFLKAGISCLAEWLLASQEGFWCMELA